MIVVRLTIVIGKILFYYNNEVGDTYVKLHDVREALKSTNTKLM